MDIHKVIILLKIVPDQGTLHNRQAIIILLAAVRTSELAILQWRSSDSLLQLPSRSAFTSPLRS